MSKIIKKLLYLAEFCFNHRFLLLMQLAFDICVIETYVTNCIFDWIQFIIQLDEWIL